jgi:hypothetical protein
VLAFRVLGRPPRSAADSAEFARLQRTLAEQWKLIAGGSREEQSAVVVPSLFNIRLVNDPRETRG